MMLFNISKATKELKELTNKAILNLNVHIHCYVALGNVAT